MQSCKGGPLLPPDLFSSGMRAARRQQPDAFQDLSLYDTDLHHVEAEARLVQALPPDQVLALFQPPRVPTWRLIRPGFCIGMPGCWRWKPSGLLSQPGRGPDLQDSLITRMQRCEADLHLVHRLIAIHQA